jgi:hypothetical protein
MATPDAFIDVFLSYPFIKVHTSLEKVIIDMKLMLQNHYETWIHMNSYLKFTPNAIESSRLVVFCLTEGFIKIARLKRELKLAIKAKKAILYLMFEDGDTKALDACFAKASYKPFKLKVPQEARLNWQGPFKEKLLKKIQEILSSHKPESVVSTAGVGSEEDEEGDDEDAQLSNGEETGNEDNAKETDHCDSNNNLVGEMEKQLVLDENENLIKDTTPDIVRKV